RTFGAPSGAFGGSNGVQSGTESRTSTFTTPLNGSGIWAPSLLVASRSKLGRGLPRWHHPERVSLGISEAERLPRGAVPSLFPRLVVFCELGYSGREAEGASMRERTNGYLQLGTVAAVALVLAAAAMAAPSATRVAQLHVTLTDGKLVVSPKTFTAGPVTFVV